MYTPRLIVAGVVAGIAAAGAGASAGRAIAGSVCVGTKPASCFATIQAAVDAAHDGDTITIGPGTFAGGISIDVSVTLKGAGAATTTISGGAPVLTIGVADAATEPTVAIKGVAITGGVAVSNPTDPAGTRDFGGGIETAFQRGHTAVSTMWGIVGLTLLYGGLRRTGRGLRIGGLALFGLSLTKLFVYDLAFLSSVARAFSFIAVGALFLVGGFFYQRMDVHSPT